MSDKPGVGDYFKIDHEHGSVGILTSHSNGRLYGIFHYGTDVKGDTMIGRAGGFATEPTWPLTSRIKKITREEWAEVALTRGLGKGAFDEGK